MRSAAFRALTLCVFLCVAACGGNGDAPAPREGLEEIPHPALDTAEPEVRRQLESLRAELEALLASPTTNRQDLASGFRRLAERYHAYDLVDAAASGYRNALHLMPEDARTHHLLGVVARLEGQHDTAADQLERALEGDAENLAARLHLAFVELDRGRGEVARAHAEGVLARDPQNAAAHLLLGRAALDADDPAAAIPAFERALELQPTALRVHYLLAQAHRKLGDLDAARRHLAEQGASEVGFADPITASLYTELAGSAALMQRAAGAKVAGFLEASVESYRQAVANAPESPEARRDLGALLAQTGRFDASVDQYREALRLEPEKALNHFSLALILEATGADDEALEYFRAAVEKEPGYVEFRRVLAERLATAGNFEEARTHFDHLLELDPRDDDSRLERAKVRAELGDIASARDDARRVSGGDGVPRLRARALQVEADLAVRSGNPAAARPLLEEALALAPDLPEAHFSLGVLAGMAEDFTTALHHFHLVTEATPERAAAWLGEATALALLGREADAAARLEEGLEALPTEGSLAFTLARLRLAAADPAVRDGMRALELAGSLFRTEASPEHAELLAQALIAVDRRGEAIDLYRRLLDQLPPDADPTFGARWRNALQRLEAEAR